MKSVDDLRIELAKVFQELRNGAIKPNEAAELANVAGKMISSAKVQIEYFALRKEAQRIGFLEQNEVE
jgi:hypothetical protein